MLNKEMQMVLLENKEVRVFVVDKERLKEKDAIDVGDGQTCDIKTFAEEAYRQNSIFGITYFQQRLSGWHEKNRTDIMKKVDALFPDIRNCYVRFGVLCKDTDLIKDFDGILNE